MRLDIPVRDLLFCTAHRYLGWPTRAGALKSYIPIPGVHTYDFFGSGHATWSSEYIRKLVPVGKQLTVMREPVAQFISSWHHWHTDEHIVSMGGPKVTLDQFLDQPDKYWKYAKWSDEALLHNSYAYDFGITSQPTPTNVATILTALRDDFDLILLTEHLDESLVLMRRLLCWVCACHFLPKRPLCCRYCQLLCWVCAYASFVGDIACWVCLSPLARRLLCR